MGSRWVLFTSSITTSKRLKQMSELARHLMGQPIECDDWEAYDARFDLVLSNGSKQQALHAQQVLAPKAGAIVGLWRGVPDAVVNLGKFGHTLVTLRIA